MSLAIVLKSALTFRIAAILNSCAGRASPSRVRPCLRPLSHRFTVEVGRQKNTLQTSPRKIRNKTRKTAEEEGEEGGGGRQRPGEPPASGLRWFLFLKNTQNEQWLQKRKSCAQRSTCGCRASEVGRESAASRPPALPALPAVRLATGAFRDILPKES